METWNNLARRERVDKIAEAVQWLCLLIVAAVELLFFLPGETAAGLVYLFLEWKLVDVSILFFAASCLRRQFREGRGYFLLALLAVVWFYVVRVAHMRLELTNKEPGTFVCAYLLYFPFAAASGDGKKQRGLKCLMLLFAIVGAVFGVYAVLLVARHLPACLQGYVFWDGARFGTMGHPNICATVLMVSVGLTGGFAARSKGIGLKILLFLLMGLEFWAASLTNSRAAIVLTCVLLGGILFCCLRGPGRKRLALALLAAVAATALLFCVSRSLFSWNNARLTAMAQQAQQTGEETGLTLDENGGLKTENGQDSFANSLKTLNGRTEIWAAAVEGIRDNPRILLIGTENVGQTISPHWKMEVQHSHNAWIEALYQLGIPGLLAALALTGLAVWNGAVLLWRNADLLQSCVAMVVLCLMGCAVMEPYLFVANAQFHYFDFLFLLCLGYMDQWRRQTRNRKGESIRV